MDRIFSNYITPTPYYTHTSNLNNITLTLPINSGIVVHTFVYTTTMIHGSGCVLIPLLTTPHQHFLMCTPHKSQNDDYSINK